MVILLMSSIINIFKNIKFRRLPSPVFLLYNVLLFLLQIRKYLPIPTRGKQFPNPLLHKPASSSPRICPVKFHQT